MDIYTPTAYVLLQKNFWIHRRVDPTPNSLTINNPKLFIHRTANTTTIKKQTELPLMSSIRI